MANQQISNKAELMTAIDSAWSELSAAVDSLNEAQMTGPKDAAGWTVKDHLAHIAAWERTIIYQIQGKPRYEALGVDEALFMSFQPDKVNQRVYEQYQAMPLPDVLDLFRDTHRQTLQMLGQLSERDLQRPYRRWLPQESGVGDGPALALLVKRNAVDHFSDHRQWLQALVAAGA